MTMSATKRFLNWDLAKFTPTGGSVINIDGVSNVSVDPGGSLLKYSGDANRYRTLIVNNMNEPKFTIQSESLGVLSSLGPGNVGVVEAVLNDAVNGDGTGSFAIKFSMSHAVLENNPMGGAHQQWATGSAVWHGYSSDGTTSPLTATVL